MKNLRKLLATVTLMAILMIGVSTANAGILLADLNGGEQPCTQTKGDTKADWGIIITGFTGIIITGFTGIIITGASDTPVDCGILLTD